MWKLKKRTIRFFHNLVSTIRIRYAYRMKEKALKKWICGSLKLGDAACVTFSRAGGGLSSFSKKVFVSDAGIGKSYFLKVLRTAPNPQAAKVIYERESLSLEHLDGRLLSPRIVACDQGSVIGSPILLTELLEGKPIMEPYFLSQRYSEIANGLKDIHNHPICQEIKVLFKWAPLKPEYHCPDWVANTHQWADLFAAASALETNAFHRVFSHGDFGPHNLLWENDRLTAVVDWQMVMHQPRQWDISGVRFVLATLCNVETAERFLEAYCSAAGCSVNHQVLFDAWRLFDLDTNSLEPKTQPFWKHSIARQQAYKNINAFADFIAKRIQ